MSALDAVRTMSLGDLGDLAATPLARMLLFGGTVCPRRCIPGAVAVIETDVLWRCLGNVGAPKYSADRQPGCGIGTRHEFERYVLETPDLVDRLLDHIGDDAA